MLRRKGILRFPLTLALFYGLLVVIWPGVRGVYGTCYRAAANTVFRSFGSDGLVSFRPSPDQRGKLDTQIAIRNRRSPIEGTFSHDVHLTGYLPAAILLALTLASPIPLPRKLRALLLGLILIHLFVVLRIAIVLVHFFNTDGPWRVVHLGPWATKALGTAFEFGVVSPVCTFLVPGLLWFLLSFRLSDIAAYSGTPPVGEDAPT